MAILSGNVFNVKDLNPALWLDAADSSTLFDATVGGNLVSDGGAVARWEDKSGNGRHATQSTLANRPLRTVGAQNTRDVLRFDGTNDTMTITNGGTIFRNVSSGTVLAVVRPNVSSGGERAFFSSLNPTGGNRFYCGINRADSQWLYGGRRLDSDSFQGIDVVGHDANSYYTFVAQLRWSLAQGQLWINGVSRSNATGFQTAGNTSDTNGTGTFIGANSGFIQYFLGNIAEIIVFNYQITDVQRQSIERYLANKWGLGFNPLSLSPALWLDASDSSTLYDATVGGNLVAAGGAVARWEDKSGNGRNIIQSTLANRPIRSVSSLGGRDTLFFDGSDDFMSSISLPASQVVHWFGVFVPQSKNAYHNIYDGSPMLWLQSSNRLEMNAAYTIGLNVSPAAYINQPIICSTRSSWAIAPGSRMRVNGAIVAQNPSLVGSFNVTRNISMFNRTNGQTFSGNFAEQLWFTTDLSNADVIAIERYLAQKWNITN